MTACEVMLAVVGFDDTPTDVGTSAREVTNSLASVHSATLRWTDGTETDLEVSVQAAEDLSGDVVVLGGDDCDPVLQAPIWLSVRSADGRLDERVAADLRGDRPGHGVIQADVYLDGFTGTFPATDYVSDPTGGRLLFQFELTDGSARGTLFFVAGLDGADAATVGEL